MKLTTFVYAGIVVSLLGLFALLGYKISENKEDAQYLAENIDFSDAAMECTIELDREQLTHDTKQKLRLLAGVSDTELEDIHVLTFKGGISGEKVYAGVYPRNAENAITDVYFSPSIDIFKVSTLYNSLRKQVQDSSTILGSLMPAWSDNEFMSVRQLEVLLGSKFDTLSAFSIPISKLKRSETEYLLLLFPMNRNGDVYEIDKDGLYLAIDTGRTTHKPLTISFSVDNPAENLDFLKVLHLNFDPEQLKVMKKISGKLEFKTQIINLPSNIIQDSTVTKLKEIQFIIDRFTK